MTKPAALKTWRQQKPSATRFRMDTSSLNRRPYGFEAASKQILTICRL